MLNTLALRLVSLWYMGFGRFYVGSVVVALCVGIAVGVGIARTF